MSTHPREHQDLVDRILGGEVSEGDAGVRERLEGCSECRFELRRLRELDAGLRAAAREARDDLDRARASVPASDEALVRDSLRKALPAQRSTRLLLLASAAGLLVLLGLGALLLLRSGSGPAEILLNGSSIRCDAPVGAVDDYDEFSWNGTLPPLGHYMLTIRVLQDDGAGDILKTIPCDGPRWTPTAEEKRALTDRIEWTVETRDVSDRPAGHGSAKAWRRSSSR